MSRALTRDLGALLMTGLGLWLGTRGDGVCPRTLAFAAATLVAFGTTASWGLGLLALGLGFTAHPHDGWPLTPSLTLVGATFGGAALGLLGRRLSAERWHGPMTPDSFRGILLLGFPILTLAEPAASRLADAAGGPLEMTLTVAEPQGLATVLVRRHLSLPDALTGGGPLDDALPWLGVLALAVAWLLFARPTRDLTPRPEAPLSWAAGAVLDQLAARLARTVATLMALAALVVVAWPLVTTTPVALDAEALRLELTLAAGSAGAVTAVSVPEAWVAPWSRGAFNVLRLALALGLLASFAPRGAAPRAGVARDERRSSSWRAVFLALAALTCAVAVGFLPEASAAAGLLGLLALVAGLGEGDRPGARAPHLGLIAAFVMLLVALALAPITPAQPLLP
jgi:hypothetical protein